MRSFDKRYAQDGRKLQEKAPTTALQALVKEGQAATKQFVQASEQIKVACGGRLKRKFKRIVSQDEDDSCSNDDYINGHFDIDTGHAQTEAYCSPCKDKSKKKSKMEEHTKASMGSKYTGHHSKTDKQVQIVKFTYFLHSSCPPLHGLEFLFILQAVHSPI